MTTKRATAAQSARLRELRQQLVAKRAERWPATIVVDDRPNPGAESFRVVPRADQARYIADLERQIRAAEASTLVIRFRDLDAERAAAAAAEPATPPSSPADAPVTAPRHSAPPSP